MKAQLKWLHLYTFVCPAVLPLPVFLGHQQKLLNQKKNQTVKRFVDTYLVSSIIHDTGSFPFKQEMEKKSRRDFYFSKVTKKVITFMTFQKYFHGNIKAEIATTGLGSDV